ncbi:MAG: hypothetical protein K2Y37_14925 [Pirellulales bacterium]|nr:hypothetical protein [Pirellulales bacterium]
MAFRLEPPPGNYHDPFVVVERLRDEFAGCEADAAAGADAVGDMIAKFIELKAPQAIIEEAANGRERAYLVTVADDMASDNCLTFLVRPGAFILIGFHSAQHEAATKPLAERCARALGYQIRIV